jgi:hypothetical protein
VRFDESRRFSTWLYGILRHRFLKARRRRRPVAGGEGEAADRPGREASPIAAAEQAEEARLVQAAVAALPDQHRVVVELRFFASASLDEIATLVGCPLGTVKSRLHHALNKLRRGEGCVNLFSGGRGIASVHPVSPTMNDQPSSCEALYESISLLAAGCLPLEEQAAVRSHLAGCRACAASRADRRKVQRLAC